ncbi:MAG: diguanylate cyclase [Chromatiales bacterium]|jgi:diguanylate cyclase (GGDEF)-like protein
MPVNWDANADSVLIVEDSKSIATLLQASISRVPEIKSFLAGSLSEARIMLEQNARRFFVAILDLNLPDATEGEVVDLVQSKGIPVVVLTGSLDEKIRDRMFQKQVADYVVKRQLSGIEYVVRLTHRIYASRERHILVVDDSRSFRLYVESLLNNHGYRTLTAENGEEGLAILKEHPKIVLVVTDYNMPKMDGLDMILEMRKVRSCDDLAIIGLSDARQDGLSHKLLKNGASDFLGKPFQVEEFYCRVDQNIDMIHHIRQAREAANRDFLTQCYNRRYFFEHGQRLYAMARNGDIHISLAMIDADYFKMINDKFGHQIGDDALVLIARLLREGLGSNGILARIGGEEFAILYVHKQPMAAEDLFDRFREMVSNYEMLTGAQRVPLSVSIGCTQNLMGSLDEMLRKADEGVYQAKAAGRNRLVCN